VNELSDVINGFLPRFQQGHLLPDYKLKTLDAITKCRTPYMGAIKKPVRIVVKYVPHTIVVAIDIVPNVELLTRKSG